MKSKPVSVTASAVGAFLIALTNPASAIDYRAVGLVTDSQSANPAQLTDPGLTNAWGLSYAPTGPFWISANGSGTSQLYSVDPASQATTKVPLTVTIPGAGNVTGQVFNSQSSGNFNGNAFLFVSEDGTVSGWRGALGSTAETLAVASPANLYKGAAYASIGSSAYLYAANFGTGAVDVIKGSAASQNLAGSFSDPNLPSGYAPFNVQNLGGSLYVTYAKQQPNSADEMAGPGLGIVDRFDLQGQLINRVATGGPLNAPWGLAIAPSSFGSLAGDLLVGNFGDGRINAYDLQTHSFAGQIAGAGGSPLSIDGLWALAVGNDGKAGSSLSLYFTAGPGDEAHGLFGVLAPVPEPGTVAMLVMGLAGVVARARQRRA